MDNNSKMIGNFLFQSAYAITETLQAINAYINEQFTDYSYPLIESFAIEDRNKKPNKRPFMLLDMSGNRKFDGAADGSVINALIKYNFVVYLDGNQKAALFYEDVLTNYLNSNAYVNEWINNIDEEKRASLKTWLITATSLEEDKTFPNRPGYVVTITIEAKATI